MATTETKHTPGPWETGHLSKTRHGFEGIFDLGDCDILPPLGNAGPVAIAAGEHNARLIAAAPELLDALVGLTRFCDAVRVQVGMGKTQIERLGKARAAIAKATGATV